ncbi:unnamed protein product [Protopolystoma xenopodis]|uniref:Uncharacterized protein n=1 Tax=Protopolystoma xenopodis TaxID=117903 RepID=A0A448WBN8_9PLAT|nr:unnamed protein product [Protopolystoma xenopodis]
MFGLFTKEMVTTTLWSAFTRLNGMLRHHSTSLPPGLLVGHCLNLESHVARSTGGLEPAVRECPQVGCPKAVLPIVVGGEECQPKQKKGDERYVAK